ncbi:MAG: ornithine cyclodeaminase family protein [Candidatus Marinimicrobia bacterium]|nr:ornithine cyclodeaminase family protein [Candidatus Neomarinimicrobiota bacterium]
MKVLIVNKREIMDSITMEECITVMENIFIQLEEDQAFNPLRSSMLIPGENGLLSMMPGYLNKQDIMGIKSVSVYPENANIGLESHQGSVTLFNALNGTPLAIMDAGQITAIRTAAVSGLATRILAKKNSKILAILGSGIQAKTHIEAMTTILNLEEIRVWSKNKKNAKKLVEEQRKKYAIPFRPFDTVNEAIYNADIICTTTAAVEPILQGKYLMQGVHINAVGSSVRNTRELDGFAIKLSKLYVDKIESTINESGDFLMAKQEGTIDDNHIIGTLGEILTKQKKGRNNVNDITLFKSLGLAVEDIATAFFIYDKYVKSNKGNWVEFC